MAAPPAYVWRAARHGRGYPRRQRGARACVPGATARPPAPWLPPVGTGSSAPAAQAGAAAAAAVGSMAAARMSRLVTAPATACGGGATRRSASRPRRRCGQAAASASAPAARARGSTRSTRARRRCSGAGVRASAAAAARAAAATGRPPPSAPAGGGRRVSPPRPCSSRVSTQPSVAPMARPRPPVLPSAARRCMGWRLLRALRAQQAHRTRGRGRQRAGSGAPVRASRALAHRTATAGGGPATGLRPLRSCVPPALAATPPPRQAGQARRCNDRRPSQAPGQRPRWIRRRSRCSAPCSPRRPPLRRSMAQRLAGGRVDRSASGHAGAGAAAGAGRAPPQPPSRGCQNACLRASRRCLFRTGTLHAIWLHAACAPLRTRRAASLALHLPLPASRTCLVSKTLFTPAEAPHSLAPRAPRWAGALTGRFIVPAPRRQLA